MRFILRCVAASYTSFGVCGGQGLTVGDKAIG